MVLVRITRFTILTLIDICCSLSGSPISSGLLYSLSVNNNIVYF